MAFYFCSVENKSRFELQICEDSNRDHGYRNDQESDGSGPYCYSPLFYVCFGEVSMDWVMEPMMDIIYHLCGRATPLSDPRRDRLPLYHFMGVLMITGKQRRNEIQSPILQSVPTIINIFWPEAILRVCMSRSGGSVLTVYCRYEVSSENIIENLLKLVCNSTFACRTTWILREYFW